MKVPLLKPQFALWSGFLIAPLTCVFNAVVTSLLIADSPLKTGEWQTIGIVAAFITGPQGIATGLIFGWRQARKHRTARALSGFCALVSIGFWVWFWNGLDLGAQWGDRGSAPIFAAALLPFLWSIGFAIFAMLARAPKT